MQDLDEQNITGDVSLLEKNIELLVGQLTDCRKENDVLRSELSSLQNILRSCKLPGTFGSTSVDEGSASGGVLDYAEKVQVKQKLVLILQKIDMELRNNQIL
jgi:hypothetical protein